MYPSIFKLLRNSSIALFLLVSCSKTSNNPNNQGNTNTPPPPPKPTLATVNTNDIQVQNEYQYVCEGDILKDGDTILINKGICWSTSTNPTTNDNVVIDTFTWNYHIALEFPRLQAKTTYYVRAFATNSLGVAYGNELTFTTPIDVGFLYQGGIIFSYDSSTKHGLIAAVEDQGRNVQWSPGSLWTISVSTPSDDGSINTANIINTYGATGTYAAQLCHDYRGGDYRDWYLPSSIELEFLKFSQAVIPGFPAYSQFDTYDYWSSSQYNYFEAAVVDINTYNNYYYLYAQQKNYKSSVRAIRAF